MSNSYLHRGDLTRNPDFLPLFPDRRFSPPVDFLIHNTCGASRRRGRGTVSRTRRRRSKCLKCAQNSEQPYSNATSRRKERRPTSKTSNERRPSSRCPREGSGKWRNGLRGWKRRSENLNSTRRSVERWSRTGFARLPFGENNKLTDTPKHVLTRTRA